MSTPSYRTPSSLLSIDTNAKTVKGQKLGFMTGILYLAPHTLAGPNICPMAGVAGCAHACLNTAGRGVFTAIQAARVNKTTYYHQDRAAFMAHLARDIAKLVRKAAAAGLTPLVRLNGTSDIKWELIPVGPHASIMEAFPDVQFYDYTKLPSRPNTPANYDLTFSYSGTLAYQLHVDKAIAAGMRLAVVFRSVADIPSSFRGLPVVPGDDSDIRHLDPQGAIVALYAKGKAKHDTSGFVVDTIRRVIPLTVAAA